MAPNAYSRSLSLNPFKRDSRSAYDSAVYTTLDQALDDPVLKDVPQSPTVADIDKLIAVEMGSAMKLTVQKLDGTSIGMRPL
jgi:U11/U12 small nuclear ribonucleoprotein SNRNP25